MHLDTDCGVLRSSRVVDFQQYVVDLCDARKQALHLAGNAVLLGLWLCVAMWGVRCELAADSGAACSYLPNPNGPYLHVAACVACASSSYHPGTSGTACVRSAGRAGRGGREAKACAEDESATAQGSIV